MHPAVPQIVASVTRLAQWATLSVRERLVVVSDLELDTSGMSMLQILLFSDSHVRPTAMAKALATTDSNVSKIAKRLAAQDLVAQYPDPTDGRAQLLALTERGRDVTERLVSTEMRLLGEMLNDWDAVDVLEFGDLLDRFTRSLLAYEF